jgi:hypothetical protein
VACCEKCAKTGGSCGSKKGNGPTPGMQQGYPFGLRPDAPKEMLSGACCEECAKNGGSCGGDKSSGKCSTCGGDRWGGTCGCWQGGWAAAPYGLTPDNTTTREMARLGGVEDVVEGLGQTQAPAGFAWGTFLLGAAAGAIVGAVVLGEVLQPGSTKALLKANPAHENFVGRRCHLPPYVRGSRVGRIVAVRGEMLDIECAHPYRRIVRVRKDRVTLI